MDGSPGMQTHVLDSEHLSPEMSAASFLLCTSIYVLLAAITIAALLRAYRRARMADAAVASSADLVPGEYVLTGTVELAESAPHAVRLEVDQEGTESESSGTWTHTWTEVDRRIKVAPFYVRTASGARVRVEPGGEVQLIDQLDGLTGEADLRRTRYAELTPGESVMAHGTLTWGRDPEARTAKQHYRDGAAPGLVLRPLGSAPMLVSSETLSDRFRRHARDAWGALAVLAGGLVLFAVLSSPYIFSALAGRVVPATVVRRSFYAEEDDESGWNEVYVVELSVPGRSKAVRQNVDEEDLAGLRRGMPVAFREVDAWKWLSHPGEDPTMNLGVLIFEVMITVGTVLCWASIRHAQVAWYECPKVVDSGTGRINER